MKRFIGLLVLASVLAAPAFAADMPLPVLASRAPSLAPAPPVFSWIGWYMGGHAGYFWGSGTNPNVTTYPFNGPGFAAVAHPAGGDVFPGLSSNGFIGGDIGYDWQLDPQTGGRPPQLIPGR
jgi:outer membrane immunogenic protein